MSWVLLRGLTREARHWNDLPDRLAGVFPGQQIVALDLPGNGVLHAQRSPGSVRAMLDSARQRLRAQDLEPPWHLLGMSLGGMLATDWAQQQPQEVARLVLINTSMRPFNAITDRLRPGNWLQLALLAARWQDANYSEGAIHSLTCAYRSRREQDLAAWHGIRQTAPVSSANAWRQLWAAACFSSAATAPPCPTLLLSSAADRLVNPRCSAQLALAWQAEHQQHPWAGHDLPHDDADWVCQRLADWQGRG